MSLEEMLAAFDAQRFAVLATSGKESPYASLIAFAIRQAVYVARFQDVSYWP